MPEVVDVLQEVVTPLKWRESACLFSSWHVCDLADVDAVCAAIQTEVMCHFVDIENVQYITQLILLILKCSIYH